MFLFLLTVAENFGSGTRSNPGNGCFGFFLMESEQDEVPFRLFVGVTVFLGETASCGLIKF